MNVMYVGRAYWLANNRIRKRPVILGVSSRRISIFICFTSPVIDADDVTAVTKRRKTAKFWYVVFERSNTKANINQAESLGTLPMLIGWNGLLLVDTSHGSAGSKTSILLSKYMQVSFF